MLVKAIKLFGDGKRLYSEGEVFEQKKEWVDMINSTPNAPLVEVLESKGEDTNGSRQNPKSSKSKDGTKHSGQG